jgi:ferric-dicitrate binding protein FerR (iron transport regulator)
MVKNENDIRINDELIVKYLTGEAEPEEAMALEDWLHLNENRIYFESFKATWHRTYPSKQSRPADAQKVWNEIHSQMRNIQVPPSKQKSANLYFKIAASLLILMVAGSLIYFLVRNSNFSEPVSINTTNELREMVLPDNSQVVLNRNSTITYEKKFGGKIREVQFSGEGFFTIAKNPERPFIVHTKIAEIKVTGTSFNISESEGSVEINVNDGEVMVMTAYDTAYLEMGERVIAREGIPTLFEKDSENPNHWAYATRKFSFKNDPLAEVFKYMEKSFPYTIRVQNKTIENCRLTANFDHVSADYMMSLIAETLDLSVTKTDYEFILEGNGCE